MIRNTRMSNANRYKLGLFGFNCSSGLAMTKVPERWDASWENCIAAARLAEAVGFEFALPVARWQGYRGATDPEGSAWAVGTEIHLVCRLAANLAPKRTVVTLDSLGCLCSTMFRVSPNHLLWILEGLVDGEVHNRIVVPEATKAWARVALDRMLDLSRKD